MILLLGIESLCAILAFVLVYLGVLGPLSYGLSYKGFGFAVFASLALYALLKLFYRSSFAKGEIAKFVAPLHGRNMLGLQGYLLAVCILE